MSAAVRDVATSGEFAAATGAGQSACCVHFWAPWAPPCAAMDAVFATLAGAHPRLAFLRVEAEKLADVTEAHGVASVPLFLFFQGGAVVDRLEGADAPALAAKTAAHAARTAATAAAAPPVAAAAAASPAPPPPPAAPPADSGAVARIKALLASCRVMLFMKGSPDAPRCGFSRRVVDALRGAGCTDFGSFDILSDEEVRTQLKAFSQWPTYPQLFVGGELLGGCDIVTEMAEGGELAAALKGGRGA